MSDDDPGPSRPAGKLPADLPGGMFGRSVYMRLDDEERTAFGSLDTESREVWGAWIAGDLTAAPRLDALSDDQRTVTMTALGLKPTQRPAQRGNQLNVTPRRTDQQAGSAGQTLQRRHQSRLNQHTAAQRYPPVGTRGQAVERGQRSQQRRSTARNTRSVIGWVLIVVGVAAVAIAQSLGRQTADLGFGFSVTAQLPWVPPVTWGGVAFAIIGLALLLTGNRNAAPPN